MNEEGAGINLSFPRKTKGRDGFRLAMLFFCGMVCGAGLSILALPWCLHLWQMRMDGEQVIRAGEAQMQGDSYGLLVARQNIVDALQRKDDSSSLTSLAQWFILEQIDRDAKSADNGRNAEGWKRARLAYSLEQAGFHDRAQVQWQQATALCGQGHDVAGFREMVTRTERRSEKDAVEQRRK